MDTLVFRVDAGPQVGTGHLMRCLALAQVWKDKGGKAVFVTSCQVEGLLDRLREEGFKIHLLPRSAPNEWSDTHEILTGYPNTWVVLDGYLFNGDYQQKIKELGHRLLVIDDMAHLKYYYADILLNQNLHAEQLQYNCQPYTRLLLGTKYVLLRREFQDWRGEKQKVSEKARRVLVTLGGADPANHTLKVVRALQKIDVPDLEAIVVIGGSNPNADMLQAETARGNVKIRLVRDARNMPELMDWADMAVASAGSTVWELAFMRVPMVLLTLAENQVGVAAYLHENKAAISLGPADNIQYPELADKLASVLKDVKGLFKLSQKAGKLVDGGGNNRVIGHIIGGKLKLRPVDSDDCRLLWEWANDKTVRAMSFSTQKISWEEHLRWFKEKLESPECIHCIVLDDNDIPVGQVRFDLHGVEADINISIDSKERGRWYGSAGIREATQKLFTDTGIKIVNAYVKSENTASIHAFIEAGFRQKGTVTMHGCEAVHLIMEKSKAATTNT
ncbi:MAG: UDP-2,4-diacetamido-2,4,6-trideoxy-beta-L-altropyranose hydrolase [Dehalococcoidales bacterium]|nr:UDP-2,4-diacetamido-2,4,6-trideoxy-beta-L-altropyranose hydrolase [Dehalococcoidales bacterium]